MGKTQNGCYNTIKQALQILRKTNISNPLLRTRTEQDELKRWTRTFAQRLEIMSRSVKNDHGRVLLLVLNVPLLRGCFCIR